MIRRLPLIALLAVTALPLRAQVIENEQIAVYAQQWVQAKAPGQNGLLSFLTLPRGQAGEYFSIRCNLVGGAETRSIRIGYPKPLTQDRAAAVPVPLTIDGRNMQATARFTGTTPDEAYTKSDIHGYELSFASAAEQKAFLDAMKAGATLKIGGQTLPVSLTGFTAALNGQGQYCK